MKHLERDCHHADAVYSRIYGTRLAVAAAALAASIAALAADMSIGSSSLTIAHCIEVLIAGPSGADRYTPIVWQVRLPMSLTCAAVGACLAMAGLQVQTITNNPLSSPYTLGISSGASLGAAAAISAGLTVAGVQWVGTALAAIALALFVTATIFVLGQIKGMSANTLVLVGIVMNFFFAALQQFIQYRASAEVAQIIQNWSFGNLSRASWTSASVAAVAALIGGMIFMRNSWRLTAFTAGEERARSLGVDTYRLKLVVFGTSALLIASGVSFIGTVGFVGLVAPHCARLIIGEDQRYLMPVTAIFGTLIMLVASCAAKLLSTGSMLPVGIVTSMVGVPFLFVLLMRSGR